MKYLVVCVSVLCWVTSCGAESSRDYNGTSGGMDITSLTSHFDAGFTFLVWQRREGGGEANFGRYFDKRDAGTQQFVFLHDSAAGASETQLDRTWSGGGGTWTWDQTPLNTWMYLAVIYDASSTANDPTLYKDGVEAVLETNGAPSGTRGTNTDVYVIGNRGADDRTFDGQLCYAVIESRNMTVVEINEFMWKPFLVYDVEGSWPMWGSNSPEIDLSGNARTGTLTSTTASTDGPHVLIGMAPL